MTFCVSIADRIAGLLAMPACELADFLRTGSTPFCFAHPEMTIERGDLILTFGFMLPRVDGATARRIEPRDADTAELLALDLRFTPLVGYNGSRGGAHPSTLAHYAPGLC